MKVWHQWLEELDKSHGKKTVDFWLRTLHVERFDARNLYLKAKDSFQIDWFNEQLASLAKKNLTTESGVPIKLHFLMPSKATSSSQASATHGATQSNSILDTAQQARHTPGSLKKTSKAQKADEDNQTHVFKKDILPPSYTLEAVLEHSGNKLPLRALSNLAQDPMRLLQEPSYNPIYLYGPKGSGKTHLLMALARKLQESGLNALYTSIPTFTHNVVQAIRKGFMPQFRAMHRDVDVVIFDDVELLAGKSATQEEFFHTFNTMHTRYKQVILSSTLCPSSLIDIQARLVSRFEWGLVASFSMPSRKEALTIASTYYCQHSSAQRLAPQSFDYLLETVGDNPADVIQAIDKIIASESRPNIKSAFASHSLLDDSRSSKPHTRESIQRSISPVLARQNKLTPEQVFFSVSDYFGVTTKDLLGKSQQRDLTRARHLALYICRKNLNLPYTKIGKLFSRDHSTIMTGFKKIEKKITDNEPRATGDYEALKSKLLA